MPAAEAAGELFSLLLTLVLYLKVRGITPGRLPALPIGWAQLQFWIQFRTAARFILSLEVFCLKPGLKVFRSLRVSGIFLSDVLPEEAISL